MSADFILGPWSQKGGGTMSEKLDNALTYLGLAAAVLTVVADAGKKVMSLLKG